MANPTDVSNTGLLNLERELVCFICTETLYQPLTLIDCLHTFCGSCLKEWFSHQHRKATSSHSSSSTASPYTCPTCRAVVKDAQHNAMVNTLLAMFLSANPTKERSQEEKQELAEVYKPGDNIMPKVEGRRRERRGRRDEDAVEARERRMVEEARERSLRDTRADPSSGHGPLSPLAPPRQSQPSRSREREERRERRREQERQDRRRAQVTEAGRTQESVNDTERQARETTSASAPTTSPRHPEAVERRRTQQTVAHQASLASLISSSESGSGSGTGSSENWQEIRQEILAEGLGFLEGIDVDALTETEQDALAERIAEAYRQRRRERNQRNNPSSDNVVSSEVAPAPAPTTSSVQSSSTLQVEDHRHRQRSTSGGRHRRAETMPSPVRGEVVNDRPRTVRTQPTQGATSLPPPTAVVTHRRRRSSQGQQSERSRNSSRRASPAARSTASRNHSSSEVSIRPQLEDQDASGRTSQSNLTQRPMIPGRTSSRSSDPLQSGGLEAVRIQRDHGSSNESLSGPVPQSNLSPRQDSFEPSSSETGPPRATIHPTSPNAGQITRRGSSLYDEPSINCYQCHRADIQYEVYRHCDKCDVDLCAHCYRVGRGCKHWYGFGHFAMAQFEASHPAHHEQVELPHVLLIGRQYNRPQQSAIIRYKYAKDGTTTIPLQTTSNPTLRFREGRFCNRCNAFADSYFWACDYCNYGEWGFCRDCVDTHHCCTHPLLPITHKSYAPPSQSLRPVADTNASLVASESHGTTLRPSPTPSQPSPATSAMSASIGPLPNYINMVINTHCDICSQPIPPSSFRYHCPFHHSPSIANPESHGDYDICTPCYHNLVKTNRIKRDDGPAGWRKCLSGHRMIITTFSSDSEGAQRRVVVNDLVGGWKTPEEAMNDWNAELDKLRDQTINTDNHSSPDSTAARRPPRARTSSWSADPSSPTTLGSPFSSSSRFPPEGGSGLCGVAWYSYFPDDTERGPNDLVFPIGAEVREVKIHAEYPDWCGGVYAGDRGLLPTSYLRLQG